MEESNISPSNAATGQTIGRDQSRSSELGSRPIDQATIAAALVTTGHRLIMVRGSGRFRRATA